MRGPTQKRRLPQVEGPIGPGVVATAIVCPMGTKHHLDRRNPETEVVVVTEREEGNPIVKVSLAPAVDFRQVVDPM